MPNTLIHIAVQVPLTRAAFPKTEIPWLLVGVLIPDLPWIFQRLFLAMGLADPYQVRLYFTVQASLVFCLLLCLSVACLSARPRRLFAILAGNCLIHLILDALQIKWGNGVHLLAPFSWQTSSFGLIWPEHPIGYILSAAGATYLLLKGRSILHQGVSFSTSPRIPLVSLAIFGYILLPFLLMNHLAESNFNYFQTLQHSEQRTGKKVEVDRVFYSAEKSSITLFTGETITVSGVIPEQSGMISLQGRFLNTQRLESSDFHRHNSFRRNASTIGLSLCLLTWLSFLFIQFKPQTINRKTQ